MQIVELLIKPRYLHKYQASFIFVLNILIAGKEESSDDVELTQAFRLAEKKASNNLDRHARKRKG